MNTQPQGPSSTKKSLKPGKIVPSRYKQAAQKKSTSRVNTPSHLHATKNTSRSMLLSVPSMSWNESPSASKRGEFTSTPTSNCTSSPVCDESAISLDQSCMPALRNVLISSDVRKRPAVRGGSRIRTDKSIPLLALTEFQKKKENSDDRLSELELDLLYSRYIQAVFLESKTKICCDKKADSALESLHKLWTVNQILMKQQNIFEQELNSLKFIVQSSEYCDREGEFYKSVIEPIATLMRRYEKIAGAIDAVKHKLNVPNVTFYGSMCTKEELFDKVNEYDHLLGSFESLLKENSELPVVAESIAKISHLQKQINGKALSCLKLLVAVDELMLSESYSKVTATTTDS